MKPLSVWVLIFLFGLWWSSYFDTEPDGKREEEKNQSQDEDHQQPLTHPQVLALQTCREDIKPRLCNCDTERALPLKTYIIWICSIYFIICNLFSTINAWTISTFKKEISGYRITYLYILRQVISYFFSSSYRPPGLLPPGAPGSPPWPQPLSRCLCPPQWRISPSLLSPAPSLPRLSLASPCAALQMMPGGHVPSSVVSVGDFWEATRLPSPSPSWVSLWILEDDWAGHWKTSPSCSKEHRGDGVLMFLLEVSLPGWKQKRRRMIWLSRLRVAYFGFWSWSQSCYRLLSWTDRIRRW